MVSILIEEGGGGLTQYEIFLYEKIGASELQYIV